MYPVLELVHEMYERGFEFLPVDIYKSNATNFIIEDDKIRPPLNSIQGFGEVAANGLVKARKEGKFMSISDMCIRSKFGEATAEVLNKLNLLSGMPKSNQINLFEM